MSRYVYVYAYAVAGLAAPLAVALPVAEVTNFEGSARHADAGAWVGVVVLVGVAAAIVGAVVRRRGLIGAALGGAAISVALALLLLGGMVAAFGVDLVVDMWDSDASGRAGPGRIWSVVSAVAALIALVLDLTWRRGHAAPDAR